VWIDNKTIPAHGLAVGFIAETDNQTITAGAASGTPSTTPVVERYHGDAPNVSGGMLYALGGSVAVTSFTGKSLHGATGASAIGIVFNGKIWKMAII
jgi:hypothetical protein